jgi:hypothetical protein
MRHGRHAVGAVRRKYEELENLPDKDDGRLELEERRVRINTFWFLLGAAIGG